MLLKTFIVIFCGIIVLVTFQDRWIAASLEGSPAMCWYEQWETLLIVVIVLCNIS